MIRFNIHKINENKAYNVYDQDKDRIPIKSHQNYQDLCFMEIMNFLPPIITFTINLLKKNYI